MQNALDVVVSLKISLFMKGKLMLFKCACCEYVWCAICSSYLFSFYLAAVLLMQHSKWLKAFLFV